LTPKRLELLSELVPQAKLFGLLVNPDEANPGTRELEEAARAKGLQLAIVKASSEGEIDAAFATLADLQRMRSSSATPCSSPFGASNSWRWRRVIGYRRSSGGTNSPPPAA